MKRKIYLKNLRLAFAVVLSLLVPEKLLLFGILVIEKLSK